MVTDILTKMVSKYLENKGFFGLLSGLKRILSLMLILAFIFAAPIGIITMEHSMSHGGGCTASDMMATPCPKDNALALLNLHANFFNLFITFLMPVAGALLVFLVITLGLIHIFSALIFSPPLSEGREIRFFDKPKTSLATQNLLAWLALKYTSPTIA